MTYSRPAWVVWVVTLYLSFLKNLFKKIKGGYKGGEYGTQPTQPMQVFAKSLILLGLKCESFSFEGKNVWLKKYLNLLLYFHYVYLF